MRRLVGPSLAAALALTTAAGAAAESVAISNFPDVQAVKGAVAVQGPVEVRGHVDVTRFHALASDLFLAPTHLEDGLDPRRMTSLGVVEADGFGSMVVSLATWTAIPRKAGGAFGILFLPDTPLARSAADRQGLTPFAWRTEAHFVGSEPVITVTSPATRLAFPRWHAYLYNTTATSLRVHAYVMLGD